MTRGSVQPPPGGGGDPTGADPREAVRKALLAHPRVVYQGLLGTDAARESIAARLPALLPFRGRYAAVRAIVDWDHRLPSRELVLRVLAYYDPEAARFGQLALEEREKQIRARDRYPEFDVPDYEGLPADESYEAELGVDGAFERVRLTSAWRRDVEDRAGQQAVDTTRRSDEFRRVRAETHGRPPHLGDLEAVGWCPPCESDYARWTIDVWYLTSFDGHVGRGRSLLVDPSERRVVAVRDFMVRAG